MTLDNGTDRQTDRRTDRVRRNMRPPPREEGRIKIGLGLASLVLCCETRSCHERRHNMILKDTATFQVLL